MHYRNVEKAKNAVQVIQALGPIISIMGLSQKKLLKNAHVQAKYQRISVYDMKGLLPILKEAVLNKKLILACVWDHVEALD